MIKRMAIMLVVVAIILGGLYGFQVFKAGMIKKAIAGMANPPQTVSTVVANTDEWQSKIEAVGSLRAVNGADLSLQVSGIVKALSFESGDTVKQGVTLLQLVADDDVAKLASLQATADNYRTTLQRDNEQLKSNSISQATVDAADANLKNAQALVDQQAVLVDQKTLKTPFAGRLGIRSVDIGQYLTAGTTIVTLQALDPIFVDLYLPQQSLSEIKVGQPIVTMVDTFPDQNFPGEITAINPKVETGSRNVMVRAKMSNRDDRLLPGMFAKVSIAVGAPQKFITLPQTAIVSNPYGDSIFVVDNKNTDSGPGAVKQTFVQTGLVRGDQIAVTKGVQQGDTVVVAGQIKLRNGTPVVVDNSHVPASSPSPSITDQ